MVSSKVKKAPAAAGVAAGSKKIKSRGNYALTDGVYRFSKSQMYHKKAVYKFIGKKTEKQVKAKKPLSVVKTVGGDKNGGTRVVLLKKRPNYYPTHVKPLLSSKKNTKEQKVYSRPSLTPGTICIIVSGRHAGKRVILVKVLKSGLALVNGPHALNACPLRRVHQNFLIATSTKIDISSVKVPEKFNDDYFRRKHQKKAKKEEGEIFAKKAEKYTPSAERKADQKAIDKQLIEAIKKHSEKKFLFPYLKSMFALQNHQFPHRMKF